jgi:competence protein ComEC
LSAIGALGTWLHDNRNNHNYFEKKTGSFLLVRISDQPIELNKTIKAEAVVKQIGDSVKWQKASGKLLLYIQKDSSSLDLVYGNEMVIAASMIKKAVEPLNPDQFDYSRYLHFRNIHHTAFIRSAFWKKTATESPNSLYQLSLRIRNYLQSVYARFLPNMEHSGIVEALVFGYTEDLDQDILSAYSRTGIIHVLSVSGLHVGIIYQILNLLISGFRKRTRYLALFPIMALWFYALITGFSPSVTRAVLMFSLFQFSLVLNRESNIYNGLFFSCFILLIVNPFWLSNVGFQLSYMAVFGIVFIQEYIKNWWPTTDWFWNKVWTLMAVSVSAQIITFPLCLYYFHQYPNLFFISNLFVIPLIFIVLILAIILPIISFWTTAGIFVAYLIDIYLYFINNLVVGIQDLPFAFFDNLYINFLEMIGIYICLIGFLVWLIYRKSKGFIISTTALAFVFLSVNLRIVQNIRKDEWIAFSIKNHYAFGLKSGRDLRLFTDSALFEDKEQRDFHCLPYFMANAGGQLSWINLDSVWKTLPQKGIWKLTHYSDTIYMSQTVSKQLLSAVPDGKTLIVIKPSYIPQYLDSLNRRVIISKTNGKKMPPDFLWNDLSVNGCWRAEIKDQSHRIVKK